MWLSLIDTCEQYPISGITAHKRRKYASDFTLITNSLYPLKKPYKGKKIRQEIGRAHV